MVIVHAAGSKTTAAEGRYLNCPYCRGYCITLWKATGLACSSQFPLLQGLLHLEVDELSVVGQGSQSPLLQGLLHLKSFLEANPIARSQFPLLQGLLHLLLM